MLIKEEIKEEVLKIAQIKFNELVQYKTSQIDITNKAKTSLNRVKEFIFEIEVLLKD